MIYIEHFRDFGFREIIEKTTVDPSHTYQYSVVIDAGLGKVFQNQLN